MYINTGYLNHSHKDFKDKSRPLIVGSCGTYRLSQHPKMPTYRPRGRLDYQIIYISSGLVHFHFDNPENETIIPAGHIVLFRPKELQKYEFVKEIYNMKKVCLAVLPALTIVLELLPLGAVCIFATSPTERVKETFSYFSLTPFGYANFAPLITATLTVAIFLLSLFSLKKKGVLKALFVLSIITVVISLLPLMYGLNYYTLVGALITVTLVIESILAKIQQK